MVGKLPGAEGQRSWRGGSRTAHHARRRSPPWCKLVDDGKLSNKLARQVIEGVLAGEGEPEQVMTDRGLAVVRDDSLMQAAVDEALAANPDVAEKIRGGKVQAAGAIVGAVMKATKGQADAARVRELVLAACGVEGAGRSPLRQRRTLRGVRVDSCRDR